MMFVKLIRGASFIQVGAYLNLIANRPKDILANTYRKTIDAISCFQVHIFDYLTCIKKRVR
jgi:hypothetical protein